MVLNGAVYLNGADEFMRYSGAFTTVKYALPQYADQIGSLTGPTSLASGPNATVWNIQDAGFTTDGSAGAVGVLDTVSGVANAALVQGSSGLNREFFGTVAAGPGQSMWLGHDLRDLGFQYGWADIYNASMQVTGQYPPSCTTAVCPNNVKGPYAAMALGRDGNMYVATVPAAVSNQDDTPHPSSIARVNPATDTLLGITTLPTGSSVQQLVPGPDGDIWFTDTGLNKIGRITSSGAVTYYDVPTASAGLQGIAPGSDNALWFAESNANKIGRVSLSGEITEYAIPDSNAHPIGISAGPLGGCVPQTMYFTESAGLGKLSFSS